MRRLFFSLLLMSLGLLVKAQELKPVSDAAAIKKAFASMNANTQSFSSDFTQTKEFSFMDRALVSHGKFYYQKNDHLRWEYTDPIQYTMLINGTDIRIKEDEKIKSYSSASNPIFKTVKEIVLGCISGDILQDPNYSPSFFANENLYQVQLQPKQAQLQEFMKEINIFLDKENNEIAYLILKDGSGDETRIDFKNRKINKDIPADVFSRI